MNVCWFCGNDIIQNRPWQHFCDVKCRRSYHWWNDGWQRRYGIQINLWEILERQDGDCALCGESLGTTWEIDHIVPLDKGGETVPSNLQALCQACNKGKWTMSTDEYIAHCKKVVEYSDGKERQIESISGVS